MAKAVSKKNIKGPRKLSIKKPGHFILLVLLVLGLGIIVNNQVADYKDRQLFEQAEAKTEEISTQIISKTGKPTKTISRNSCGRANLKFAEGPLVCNVTKHHLFIVSNFQEANQALTNVSALSEHPIRPTSLSQEMPFAFVEEGINTKSQEFFQKIENFDFLHCNFSFEYPINDKSAYYDLLEPQAPENLRIGVSCGGPARTQHYPLRD